MKYFILTFCLGFVLLFPFRSQAVVPMPFGGYNVFAKPCLCSAGTVWYVWYAPLHLGSPAPPITGAMAVGVPPSSLWYAYFDPQIPTTWSLGHYMPGVQSCWQPATHGCNPWPVLGHVYQVGSSLPGAIP